MNGKLVFFLTYSEIERAVLRLQERNVAPRVGNNANRSIRGKERIIAISVARMQITSLRLLSCNAAGID